jgi:uncharacterized protein (TIGR02391 family)
MICLNLLQLFPKPHDLLDLEPEDLAGILIEVIPSVSGPGGFRIDNFIEQLSPLNGGYGHQYSNNVARALAEALSWLLYQGIIIENPGQPNPGWYLLSRRGETLKTRANVEAFQKGRNLPSDLLQPALDRKVRHLFLRGDHDTAVFQAFKEVEVAVRKAGGYTDGDLGKDLMTKAFNPDNGPLADVTRLSAESQAEMFLFAGAMGHAKNPPSHRDVGLSRQEAAKLIIFASYLLDIVEQRTTRTSAPVIAAA